MDLPAEVVWRTYRGRADCENRIKELKYDFGADSFNMKDFWATEAALNTVMLAYNLMSLFRQVLVKSAVLKKGVSVPIAPRYRRCATSCLPNQRTSLQRAESPY
jgi:IS4 transposase